MTADTEIADLDENFASAKNYLLFGGLAGVAIDAYVIAMAFLGGAPSTPAAPEEVPPTDAPADGTTELFNW